MHNQNTPIAAEAARTLLPQADRNDAYHADHTNPDGARHSAHGYADGVRHALAVVEHVELQSRLVPGLSWRGLPITDISKRKSPRILLNEARFDAECGGIYGFVVHYPNGEAHRQYDFGRCITVNAEAVAS